ncbi:uncharacterized protein Tco025E_00808 [Trypanosoma conorhini]|uniref:Uncharacterized protein n=1 Tax=Trypanosoma conorhini TaxID=83891 RepID=A0A3R7M5G4_9TRYP|nr:uncharacterized protein Tco025E_00808 [Trypanosoma conorhini]RNF26942.1 hypothetical protein Tco025E_00808 [Trypanosoma conorhini]
MEGNKAAASHYHALGVSPGGSLGGAASVFHVAAACCCRRSVRLALASSATRFSSLSSRSREKDLMGSSFGGQSSPVGSSASWNTNPLVGRISTGASPLVIVADLRVFAPYGCRFFAVRLPAGQAGKEQRE